MRELSRSDHCVRCLVFPARNSESTPAEQRKICHAALDDLLDTLYDNEMRSGIVDLSAYLLEDD
jgi:hypothetical protein